MEVPACQEAFQVEEDRQGLPYLEEGRASSGEDPWVAVHKDLECLVQTSAEEDQEEAALAFHQEDLVHTLEEVLVQGDLASSDQEGQEGACQEVALLAAPALDEEHIALEVEDLGASLREWEQEGVCT